MNALIPVLNLAVEELRSLLGREAYTGYPIVVEFDPTLEYAGEARSDRIVIRDYPRQLKNWSYTGTYFHELGHVFTLPKDLRRFPLPASFREAVAMLTEWRLFLKFYQQHGEETQAYAQALNQLGYDALQRYTSTPNAFSHVKWNEAHPGGDLPSDQVALGILLQLYYSSDHDAFLRTYAEIIDTESYDFADEAQMLTYVVWLFARATGNPGRTVDRFANDWQFNLSVDSDGDGLSDQDEILKVTDPLIGPKPSFSPSQFLVLAVLAILVTVSAVRKLLKSNRHKSMSETAVI